MTAAKERVYKFGKTYLKDVSFECPNVPEIFVAPEAQVVSVECGVDHRPMAEGFYEVELTITVKAKKGERTSFAVEVQQGGVFEIRAVSEEELLELLEITCPDMLMGFAREVVCNLVVKGGFPQLLIDPVNFRALYEEKRALLAKATPDRSGS